VRRGNIKSTYQENLGEISKSTYQTFKRGNIKVNISTYQGKVRRGNIKSTYQESLGEISKSTYQEVRRRNIKSTCQEVKKVKYQSQHIKKSR
jgi:hypothetical protein